MIVTAAIFMNVRRMLPAGLAWTRVDDVIANAYAVVVFLHQQCAGQQLFVHQWQTASPDTAGPAAALAGYLVVLEGLALLVCLIPYAP